MMRSLGKDESDRPGSTENMARVYFAEGESGWVEIMGPGYVRVANIPFDGKYNIDDLVKVDVRAVARDPYDILKGKIEKRVYPVRTILEYPTEEHFHKVAKLAKALGAKMENAMGPRGCQPGYLLLAAKDVDDVRKIVRDVEIPQHKGWKPNFLK